MDRSTDGQNWTPITVPLPPGSGPTINLEIKDGGAAMWGYAFTPPTNHNGSPRHSSRSDLLRPKLAIRSLEPG